MIILSRRFGYCQYNLPNIWTRRRLLDSHVEKKVSLALRGFRQLMALHIHNNQLRTLGSLSFMNLPILNLLNLASNRVDSIHRQAFLNVPQLRYLYMTDNHLGEILPHQFASFEQLEMIDLR